MVSRQVLIESRFLGFLRSRVHTPFGAQHRSTIGPEEGPKQASSTHCDELVSLPKLLLTHYVGQLNEPWIEQLNRSLLRALALDDPI